MTFDVCSTKTRLLRSSSLSYQKKDWQAGPRQPFSLSMTPSIDYIVKLVSYQMKDGQGPSRQSVLSELFVVGGSDGVYRRMHLCRVAQYNHKYLFEGGVRGVWGCSPKNLRDFRA